VADLKYRFAKITQKIAICALLHDFVRLYHNNKGIYW